MRLTALFGRARPEKSAHATIPQQIQQSAPSGSWTAFVLALTAACLLLISAAAQNVSYGYALGAVHSEFRAVVLAMASAGATLLAPVCFAAVVTCFRRRSFGVSMVALLLGTLALLYAATCSLGTVAGSRDLAVSEHLQHSESAKDRRALIEATRAELAGLRGTRADIVERRSELTSILVKLSDAAPGKSTSARPDSQAAGVAFVLSAFGWKVSEADVGQWINVGTVLFLELAAALSLTVAAALYPTRQQSRSEGGRTTILPAEAPAPSKPADRAPAPSKPAAAASKTSRKEDDDDESSPPKARGKGGRPATVIPAEALDRLRKAGGKANGSIRGVGKLIGAKSKTAAHRVLHRLADDGLIRLQVGQRGVAVALA
jgi:hypothetical protein